MSGTRRTFLAVGAAALVLTLSAPLWSQGPGQGRGGGGVGGGGGGGGPKGNVNPDAPQAPGPGAGRGFRGPPPGRGPGGDPTMEADQKLFQILLDNRALIRRKVQNLPNGVETLTETDDAALRQTLVTHVASMKRRVEEGRPIHLRDPLFRELFRHADKIKMEVERTEKGVRVRETSTDPYVAKLIQQHAEVVSAFLKNGHLEVRKNHPVRQ